MSLEKYVLTLSCPNRPGIVAKISALLFSVGGNITEAHQFDDAGTGKFFMRVVFTAADLAVLLAALSSFRDRPVPHDWVVFGEVGLSGEIRPVPGGEDRIREAAKHGFKRAIVPAANRPRAGAVDGIEVVGVRRLSEALDAL